MTGSVVRSGRGAKILSVVAVVLAVTMIAGCGQDAPRLQFPEGKFNPFGLVMGGMRAKEDGDFGSIFICLSQRGRATITAVRPVHPTGGFKVQQFAVRLNPRLKGKEGLGGATGSLWSKGFADNHVVDIKCGVTHDAAVADEIGVEITRPAPADAGSDGFNVYYRSDGEAGTLRIPFVAALCSGNPDSPACKRANPWH